MEDTNTKLKFRKDINFLRSVAVLGVLFYHTKVFSLSGGFLGVDIFFVISGYLISYKLVSEILKNNFSFKRFYIKRARRILPALYFLLFFSIILGTFLLSPNDINSFKASLLYTTLFTSNLYFWNNVNYFSDSIETRLLAHTWSLGVEEQFYFILPIGVFLIFKITKSKYFIFLITIIGIFTSLYFAISDFYFYPITKFYWLHTRAWQFLLGTLASLISIYFNIKKSSIISNFSLLMIFVCYFSFNSSTEHPGILTILPTVSCFLFILFNPLENKLNNLIDHSIFQFLGNSSYSIYLFHYPIFALSIYWNFSEFFGISDFIIESVFILSSIFFGFLSWKYIETPTRDINLLTNKRLIVTLTLSSLLLISLGTTNIINKINSIPFNSVKVNFESTPRDLVDKCLMTVDEIINTDFCLKDYDSTKVNYLILGDSLANNLYWGMKNSLKANETISLLSVTGCVPLIIEYNKSPSQFNEKKCINNYLLINKAISDYSFDKIVIVYNFQQFDYFDNELKILNNSKNLFFENIKQIGSQKVYITGQPIIWKEKFPNLVYKNLILRQNILEISFENYQMDNLLEYEQLYKNESIQRGIKYFSFYEYFCNDLNCNFISLQDDYYYFSFKDKVHFTYSTSNEIGSVLTDIIRTD